MTLTDVIVIILVIWAIVHTLMDMQMKNKLDKMEKEMKK